MRKQKTEEEKALTLEHMTESCRQLQAKEGPYYERWLKNYTAWRKSRAWCYMEKVEEGVSMSERYPPEFFAWAQAHGWPERGPHGSEINKVRAKMLPGLYSQWLRERKEAARATV